MASEFAPHVHRDTDFLSLLVNAPESVDKALIRDEVMTMLLAGHETTSVALSWAVFLLSRHSEYQQKLRREVAESSAGNHESSRLSELPYTQMILNEAMRLYPPVWIIPRKAKMRDEVGGFDIERGSQVLICVYNIHRNPHSWPQPDVFNPERFRPEAQDHDTHQFMPFGLGPRVCIGKYLALLEGRILLARMVDRFTFREIRQDSGIELDPLLTLRPKGKILINLN